MCVDGSHVFDGSNEQAYDALFFSSSSRMGRGVMMQFPIERGDYIHFYRDNSVRFSLSDARTVIHGVRANLFDDGKPSRYICPVNFPEDIKPDLHVRMAALVADALGLQLQDCGKDHNCLTFKFV